MRKEKPKPYLDTETNVKGDETVDSDILTRDIEEALADLRDNQPEKSTRVTWYTDNGQRVGPEMLPNSQMEARKAWLDAGRPAELFQVMQELLRWAGRDARTQEETLELQQLRKKASDLLGLHTAA